MFEILEHLPYALLSGGLLIHTFAADTSVLDGRSSWSVTTSSLPWFLVKQWAAVLTVIAACIMLANTGKSLEIKYQQSSFLKYLILHAG